VLLWVPKLSEREPSGSLLDRELVLVVVDGGHGGGPCDPLRQRFMTDGGREDASAASEGAFLIIENGEEKLSPKRKCW
jgi:hypothetical protein